MDAVVAVVAQPPRPKGRDLRVASCPTHERAVARGVPVLTPERVNAPGSVAAIRDLAPDLIVVVAYGQILRRELLAVPPRGCVNLHTSLLPKYRGAAPIQWAVANGESVTGVTTMYMNERMDEGDIVLQDPTPVGPEETAGELHDRLATQGAALLARTVGMIREGRAPRRAQVAGEATYAPKLAKEDGRLDWRANAPRIHDRVRGFNPWPGCFCLAPGTGGERRPLRVLRCRVEAGAGVAGEILDAGREGPLVATGDGSVRLTEVQPAGRAAMSGAAYLRGHALRVGDRLE
jgi:methionyl-tRNA formyltransferase